MEPEIALIWYPVDDPAQPLIRHIVGVDGVTRIVADTWSPEPYCHRTEYVVYEGSAPRWRLSSLNAGVEYQRPVESPAQNSQTEGQ